MKFTLNETEEIKLLHRRAEKLLKDNLTEQEIISELIKEGIDQNYARIVIENVLKDLRDRRAFWWHILGGLFFILGGLVINYLSYISTGSGAFKMFYFFWGILVIGVVMIFRAFILFRK